MTGSCPRIAGPGAVGARVWRLPCICFSLVSRVLCDSGLWVARSHACSPGCVRACLLSVPTRLGSDVTGTKQLPRDSFALPASRWMWGSEWSVDKSEESDREGWEYAVDFPLNFHKAKQLTGRPVGVCLKAAGRRTVASALLRVLSLCSRLNRDVGLRLRPPPLSCCQTVCADESGYDLSSRLIRRQ